jgi:RimJ/RimL family protein N-acetyltransferase
MAMIRPLLPGIRVIRLRPRLGDREGLELHRFRLRDTRCLQRLFSCGTLHAALEASAGPPGSLLGFWRWLHRTFRWFYTITDRTRGPERILGFIGLYDMQARRSVKLAIAFFRPQDRGRGYGRRALELLLADFHRRGVVQAVHVDIRRQNDNSLAFFRRMGFQPAGSGQKVRHLTLPL